MPLRIDTAMPGMLSKNSVSSIAFQSLSDTDTAELFSPVIRTGS